MLHVQASVVGTTVIAAVALNDATRNLAALTLSNLFYLGEIISVSPASMTANMPQQNVTGFVEAITWTHIVIRDFYRKQVFISHQSFQTLMVTNWTRRPAKLCHYILSVSTAGKTGQVAAKVSRMSNVVRKWLDDHPDIDQSCYKKSAIKATVFKGIDLEVVFYPRQKAESIYRLRAEFIMILFEVSAGGGMHRSNRAPLPRYLPVSVKLPAAPCFDTSLTIFYCVWPTIGWFNLIGLGCVYGVH